MKKFPAAGPLSHDAHAWILVMCCVAFGVAHSMAWSKYPTDVDPINFTTALDQYDISSDSPHPPGYPLFVFAGRVAKIFVGTSHAFQLVNLCMTLATAILLYLIFRAIRYPLVGLGSAVLLLTHPLVWAATVTPECYISDTLFATAIVHFGLNSKANRRMFLIGISLLFFLLGLIRPVSGFMLVPAALVASWHGVHQRRHYMSLVICAIAGVCSAYLLTIWLAGGLQIYQAATRRVMGSAFHASSVLGGASWHAHLTMLSHLYGWLFLLAFPALISIFLVLRGSPGVGESLGRYRKGIAVGLAWLIPPLLFYSFLYYLKPTYQLIYLPCLLVPVAWYCLESRPMVGGIMGISWLLVLAALQMVIVFGPIEFPRLKLPISLERLSESFVLKQDAAWTALIGMLDRAPKQRTLLVWVTHPRLSIYAVRLLDGFNAVAIPNSDQSELQYLDRHTMHWEPTGADGGMIDEKFDGVVFVLERNGEAAVDYLHLDTPDSRNVRQLLVKEGVRGSL